MQKSIEVEYWVVDGDGALTTPGSLTDDSEYVEEEFVEPLVELKTPPCETHADLRATFVEQLQALCSRAEDADKLLVPLGTPINAEPIDCWPDERGRIQERVLGSKFQHAKYCAGTHLHFEQRNVADQLNVLTALDPALALLNTSPYFRGRQVADGARATVYRKRGYEEFPKHGQLWSYVDTVAEWKRRLERRYEEFRAAALDAGVEGDRFDEQFSADDAVWTPVRLREEMPTVEWRSPDATLPSQILRVAEDVGRLMERLHHTNVTVGGTTGGVAPDGIRLPAFETVREYADAAMADGTSSSAVTAYLRRMGFDVDGYDPIAERIDRRGYVTKAEARELRLEYGKLLRRDVRTTSRRSSTAIGADGRLGAPPADSA